MVSTLKCIDSRSTHESSDTVLSGSCLALNETRTSPNGNVTLVFNSDGNFAVNHHANNLAFSHLWYSHTYNRGAVKACMQLDGNFVISDAKNEAIWSTNTTIPGGHLKIQDNGRFAIYQGKEAKWILPDYDTIFAGTCMFPGEARTSSNGLYLLLFQYDGNFVIYAITNGSLTDIWMTRTHNKVSDKACMQFDGNFVILNSKNETIWSSNTTVGDRAVLQDDGSFAIYQGNDLQWIPQAQLFPDTILAGTCLGLVEYRMSLNRKFRIIFQTDGNLVIYGTGKDLFLPWNSGTDGKGADKACMQFDGNFVISNSNNETIWSIRRYVQLHGAYNCAVIDNNGKFVIKAACSQIEKSKEQKKLIKVKRPCNDTIESGEEIPLGHESISCNRCFRFVLQKSGALEILSGPERKLIWSSNTTGFNITKAVMEEFGEFRLWSDQESIWRLNQVRRGQEFVEARGVIEDNGLFVIKVGEEMKFRTENDAVNITCSNESV